MQMLKIFLSHAPFVRKSHDNMLYYTNKLTKEEEDGIRRWGEILREIRDAQVMVKEDLG